MNTLDIFCFTSVARTKSFSITARELLISQQAVSRHIKSMEDELGFPLFLRNYQSVQLTEAGSLMLSYFLERDSLLSAYQRSRRNDSSPACLHIGISQWLGSTEAFHDVLTQFSSGCPEVRLYLHELTALEAREMLLQEQLDLLLTTRYSASFLPVDWRVQPFSEEPLFLLGSAGFKAEQLKSSSFPVFGPAGGEADIDSARAALRVLCTELGIWAERIEILPDMGSVCLNVLLQKGLAPSLRQDSLTSNPEYAFYPMNRSVSVVLCTPHQPADPALCELARIAAERREAP